MVSQGQPAAHRLQQDGLRRGGPNAIDVPVGRRAGQLVAGGRPGCRGRTSTPSPGASGWGSPRQQHGRRARAACRGCGTRLVTPGRRAPAGRPPGGPKPQGFASQPRHPSGAAQSACGQASGWERLEQGLRGRLATHTHLRGRGRRRCSNKASPLTQPLGGGQLHRPRPRAAGHRCGHGRLGAGGGTPQRSGGGLSPCQLATSRAVTSRELRKSAHSGGHGACPGPRRVCGVRGGGAGSVRAVPGSAGGPATCSGPRVEQPHLPAGLPTARAAPAYLALDPARFTGRVSPARY